MNIKNALLRSVAAVLMSGLLISSVGCSGNGDVTTAATEALQTERPNNISDGSKLQIVTDSATEDISFTSLPLGDVKARSWLLHQARLIADNITKDMESLSPDCKSEGDDRSGWLGGTGDTWERGPYYVRGLVSLAYTLDDAELKSQAQKWIDWTLSSQVSSGAFGPYAATPAELDYWPLMPMLIALEIYADATGDERVIPFLKKYFDWQIKTLPDKPLSEWSQARGGDNILAVYWYMERTGDRSYGALAELLHKQTQKWSEAYTDKAWESSYHAVSVNQSLKLYPIMFALTGENKYIDYYYKGLDSLYIASGRADGMINGDEYLRGILATYGSETCSVVERMLSDEIALLLLRDASIADNLEYITYNAFPQQLLPDGKGQVYFTAENQIDASLGSHGFTSEGGDRSVYGAPGGFPCCIHNYQMGWPLFISSMWMGTSDKGLAAGAYGPCSVTATVGNGTNVTLTEETDYPYEETVTVTVSADKTDTYPIYLRIPEWCDTESAVIKVNGEQLAEYPTPGEYFCLKNEWRDGDRIEMTFPRKITLEYGDNNSVSVRVGGVLFAMALTENKQATDYNPLNWARKVGDNVYSSYSITTDSTWNAVLTQLDFDNPENTFSLTTRNVKNNMTYVQEDAPMLLTAKARVMPSWVKRANNTAGALPVSPVASDKLEGEEITVSFLPYAFTRLRMTSLPWTGDSVIHTAVRTDDNRSLVFENVVATTEARSENDTSYSSVKCDMKLTASASYSKDLTFILSVNNKEVDKLTLKKGETRMNVSKYVLRNSRHNKITLTLDNGELLPRDISVALELICGELSVSRYEAEFAKILGKAYSAGSHITGIDNTGDGIKLTVTVPENGEYLIRSFYSAPMSEATHTLKINGAACGKFEYKKTKDGKGAFSDDIYSDIHISLPAGEHEIEIVRMPDDEGSAELDALEIAVEVKKF